MSVTSPPLRGVHRRLAFPPPAARPSLSVWADLADADDELAWALFFVLRRVRDLADAPPAGVARWKRATDVRSAAAQCPEIAADLLLLGAPQLTLTDATRGRVAGACNRIAEWATERGYGELAVQLAEAAVAVQPGNARRVYEAGRINRLFGRLDDAELLYSRAVCLARPGRHWWVYVRAHTGIGHIWKHRGELDRAAAHYRTAARGARDRSGEKWLAALIEHDLFATAAEGGSFEIALHHARRAFEWMPAHHARVPALVHDFAFLLLQMNAFSRALELLDHLVAKRLSSADMVLAWSTYGRAAAATGRTEEFRRAQRQVEALVNRFDANAAAAHSNLGAGAHMLGLAEDAARHALQSSTFARARRETRILGDATALLAAVAEGGAPAPLRETEPTEAVRRLALSLADRLAAWRGATWKRKRQTGGRLSLI